MVMAPFFLKERVLATRLRVLSFTLLTPFFFLKAGFLGQIPAPSPPLQRLDSHPAGRQRFAASSSAFGR